MLCPVIDLVLVCFVRLPVQLSISGPDMASCDGVGVPSGSAVLPCFAVFDPACDLRRGAFVVHLWCIVGR